MNRDRHTCNSAEVQKFRNPNMKVQKGKGRYGIIMDVQDRADRVGAAPISPCSVRYGI